MHLFTFVSLSVLGLASSWDDWFERVTKDACPGTSVKFLKSVSFYNDMYFKPKNGDAAIKVANITHILIPPFLFQDNTVVLPEMKKEFEGTYFWSSDRFRFELRRTEVNLKDCSINKELRYGQDFSLEIPEAASILEFTPPNSKLRLIQWSRINTDNQRGARGTVSGHHWVAHRATQADEGRYVFLKENGVEVASTKLTVKAHEKYRNMMDLEDNLLRMQFPVAASEAILRFYDSKDYSHELFHTGQATEGAFRTFGNRIEFESEDGDLVLIITDLTSSDVGRYEVHDTKQHRAYVMWLSGSDETSVPDVTVPIGVSICIALMVFCCCCVRKWCRKTCAAPPPPPQSAASPDHTPAAVQSYAPRPRAPSTSEVTYAPHSRPRTPTNDWGNPPPSYDELMRDGPAPYEPYKPPPDYNMASAGAGVEGGGEPGGAGVGGGDAPTVPSAPLDPGYQYQPSGWPGGLGDFLNNSPLGPDTDNSSSVYSSAKLNF